MRTQEHTTRDGAVAVASESLTITDNRTGRTYEVPVNDGTIRANALRDINVGDDDFGVMSCDPAFMNTASCRSAITYLDGEAGVLAVPKPGALRSNSCLDSLSLGGGDLDALERRLGT